MCHEGAVLKAPNRAALKQMSAENVRFALVSGNMAVQGLGLTTAQITDLAEFLTGKVPVKEQVPAAALCADAGPPFADPLTKPHWNGRGVNLEQHWFQPAEMAHLTAEQVPKLKLKWAETARQESLPGSAGRYTIIERAQHNPTSQNRGES